MAWRVWRAAVGVSNSLETLTFGEAYFVMSGETVVWEFAEGVRPEPAAQVELAAGLNNVVYPGPTLPVEQALGAIAGEALSTAGAGGSCIEQITAIFRLDADQTYRSWTSGLPGDLQSIRELREGGAYWIASRGPVTCEWAAAQDGGEPAFTVPLQFTDVTEAAGLLHVQQTPNALGNCLLVDGEFCEPERMSGGAAAADYDNDGAVDLYVTRLDAPDIPYHNRGDGTFEDRTAAAGLAEFDLRSNGAGWADIDNDGDQDLYVTTIADTRFYLFINDGAGRFSEEAIPRGAAVESDEPHVGYSVAFGDYDRDGWLDIHTTEWRPPRVASAGAQSHNRLLRNLGASSPGRFEDVTEAAGVSMDGPVSFFGGTRTFAFASAFVDFDGDAWPDLAIAADFGNSRLFWNNGDGTFSDGTDAAGVGTDENGMGSTFGDYDGDGDLDWFVTSIFDPAETCETTTCNWGYSGNRLYRNDGDRQFSDATDSAGVRDGYWGWGTVFFDADNDGDLDLTMTNGFVHLVSESPFEADPMRYWENDGTGRMRERSAEVGIVELGDGKGLLTFDYDGDGDLYLLVVNNSSAPRLYRNDGGNANGWLRVRVIGDESNRDGIGARVTVRPSLRAPSQLREIGARSHFLGQSELTEHFGLGTGRGAVAEVRVEWPASGSVTVLHDVPANSTIVVREGQAGFEIESPTLSVSEAADERD